MDYLYHSFYISYLKMVAFFLGFFSTWSVLFSSIEHKSEQSNLQLESIGVTSWTYYNVLYVFSKIVSLIFQIDHPKWVCIFAVHFFLGLNSLSLKSYQLKWCSEIINVNSLHHCCSHECCGKFNMKNQSLGPKTKALGVFLVFYEYVLGQHKEKLC